VFVLEEGGHGVPRRHHDPPSALVQEERDKTARTERQNRERVSFMRLTRVRSKIGIVLRIGQS
jgi:hypothetical protein